VPAATVCVNLSCLHLPAIRNHFWLMATNSEGFGTLHFRRWDGEQSGPTAWERRKSGGIWWCWWCKMCRMYDLIYTGQDVR